MDGMALMMSFLFGTVGLGMMMYGKKAGKFLTMGVGAGLMVVPYFLSNVLLMVVVCGGMMVVPWVVREG